MKKYLFYIMATAALLGYAKQQDNKSDVFVSEKIKTDTLYHIAAINGDLLFYDSVRIETRHFPARYIRWISNDDCIVFIGSDTLTYNEFRGRYYEPVAIYTHAQRDTITNVHARGFYKVRDIGRWALRSILVTGYRP